MNELLEGIDLPSFTKDCAILMFAEYPYFVILVEETGEILYYDWLQ